MDIFSRTFKEVWPPCLKDKPSVIYDARRNIIDLAKLNCAAYLHVCDGVDFCLTLGTLLKLFHQLLYVAADLTEI